MDASPSSKRVGLYFGSFNPVHLGHLVIANHMLQHAELDEVWLVVTPTSPHKQGVDLIPEKHRLQMVKLALADHPQLRASSVEFDLPRPNYTARTMEHLRASHRTQRSASSWVKTTWRRFQRGKTTRPCSTNTGCSSTHAFQTAL